MVTQIAKLPSEEAKELNRKKTLTPEDEMELGRVISYSSTVQKLHFYMKGLLDGGKKFPIAATDLDNALDYVSMLLCARRNDIQKKEDVRSGRS